MFGAQWKRSFVPCPQYVRTTEHPFWRAIGSLGDGRRRVSVPCTGGRDWRGDAHRLADVAEERTGLADLDGLVEALARRANESQ